MKAFITTLCILSSALLIISCGGGGGGGTSPSPGLPGNPPGNLNPNLSGALLFEYENNAWLMNISSGNYRKIPNTFWPTHENIFGGADRFWLDVAPDNSKFIVTSLDDCDTSGALTYEICVGIQDFDGNYLANYRFLGNSESPAKLSTDNQYFAIINKNDFTNEDRLQIYDISGHEISSRVVEASDFEWLADNSIVYSEERKFVFTEALSTNPTRQLSLPNGMDGTIGTIDFSPNRDTFAFTLITSGTQVSTHATPWIVSADGTGLRQLAISTSDDPPPSITSPKWSPDGKWILLKEGAYTGNNPQNPGSSGYAYVVPAENLGKTFVLSIVDAERSSEAILLNRYERIEDNSSGSVINKHFSSTSYWIP